MDEAKIPADEQARFWPLLERYVSGERGCVPWETIEKLAVGDPGLIDYDRAMAKIRDPHTRDLSDLAVVKLNGGLGTGMGLDGPKTLVKVTPNEDFLAIVLGQLDAAQKISGAKIPLVLMNSFNTEAATKNALAANGTQGVSVLHMIQGTFLRIQADGEPRPLPEEFGRERFNPPGHGDVYSTLRDSGVLAALKKQGKKFLFIANGDNLGATPDPAILAYLREKEIPFLMEFTARTANDVKGGTVFRRKSDHRLGLLELANIEEAHQKDFQDLTQFPVFNTNNIWVNIESLETELKKGPLAMDLIVNPKMIGSIAVVQLEQAMGSAISSFPGAQAMVVPRERFRPVKSTTELFLLRSNLFSYSGGVFRAQSDAPLPTIVLSDYFKKIKDFEIRVPHVPNLTNLTHLKVEGNVAFGKNIVLEGQVTIRAGKELARIPDGTHLKNGTYSF